MTTIELDGRWHITGHLNGGYLAAVCGQAAVEAFGGGSPLTISTHYLAPARGGGPADAEVEVLREGRLSTARVSLARDGVLLLESLVTVARGLPVVCLQREGDPRRDLTVPPLDVSALL